MNTTPWPAARRLLLAGVLVAAGVLAAGATPAGLSAQLSRADSAAVILRTADEFERQGEVDVAEALYRHLLERFPSTPAGAEARARLTRPSEERAGRVSRLELPVFGTLYGLWLGTAIPSAFDATSSEAYGAGLLLGVPAGLFSAIAAQRAQQYTEGQARAITWGATFGTAHGLGWAEVLDIGEDQYCDSFGCYDTGDNGEELLTSAILGGLVGIAAGAVIARNPVRSGVASAAQGGSIWGAVYGGLTASVVDPDVSGDTPWAVVLLSSGAGLLAGEALGSRYDVSRGRVRLMNLGALGGGLVGLGIDLLADPVSDRTLVAIPLFTSVAGLAIATAATRDYDRVGGGEPSGSGFALFDRTGEGWSVNPPLPIPTMIESEGRSGRAIHRPGLRFELLRARFR